MVGGGCAQGLPGRIFDVSGDPESSMRWYKDSATGGEIVLAGVLDSPLSVQLSASFHARTPGIRVAAIWQQTLGTCAKIVEACSKRGTLSLDGLVTIDGLRRTRLPPTPSLSTTRPVSRWSWTGVRAHEHQARDFLTAAELAAPPAHLLRDEAAIEPDPVPHKSKKPPRSSRSTERAASARVSRSPIFPT